MWSVSNVCHGKESKEWRHMCHIFAIFDQDDFKALSRSKAQVLLFDTESDDTIGCLLNTCENPVFHLVLIILLLHMMSSNRCTQEYIRREKQNKMTCPKVSCKFSIWVLFSTPSFVYKIEKLLLFCTSSICIPYLFLNVGFVSMSLKEQGRQKLSILHYVCMWNSIHVST